MLVLLSMICVYRTVHVLVLLCVGEEGEKGGEKERWRGEGGKRGVSHSGGCLPPDHAESWVQVEVGVVSLQEAWSPQLKVGCWTVTIGKEVQLLDLLQEGVLLFL